MGDALLDRADRAFERIPATDPRYREALIGQASVADRRSRLENDADRALGHLTDARRFLERARELEPGDGGTLVNLAIVASETARRRRLKRWEADLAPSPLRPPAPETRDDLLMAAADCAHLAKDPDPDLRARSLAVRAEITYELGDPEKAVVLAERAARDCLPASKSVMADLCELRYRIARDREDHESAVKWARKRVAATPSRRARGVLVRSLLAMAARRSPSSEVCAASAREALQEIDRLLGMEGDLQESRELRELRCEALVYAGRPGEAAVAIQQVLGGAQPTVLAHVILSGALTAHWDSDGDDRLLEKASAAARAALDQINAEGDPVDQGFRARAHYLHGLAEFRLRDYRAAAGAFTASLRADPADHVVQRARRLSESNARRESGFRLMTWLVRVCSATAFVALSLGWLAQILGWSYHHRYVDRALLLSLTPYLLALVVLAPLLELLDEFEAFGLKAKTRKEPPPLGRLAPALPGTSVSALRGAYRVRPNRPPDGGPTSGGNSSTIAAGTGANPLNRKPPT